ncbi:MAG: nucleotidyltransferase substrate binding protein [Fibrobacterota bacterium]|nr:nucleotidyltransferase substrate binding protein [Fibrobacterota bacterium]
MKDIRWKQRFNNYLMAFQTLVDAVELSQSRKLSSLEQQGLIQSFEFTHELAWNVLKDYLEHQGFTNVIGSKDASRIAFKNGLIEQGEDWMKMIEDRNLTSHAYHQDIAEAVADDIIRRFYPAFQVMVKKFQDLSQQQDITP